VNEMPRGAGTRAAMFCALLLATFLLASGTMRRSASILAQSATPAAGSVEQADAPHQTEAPPPQEPAKRKDQRVTGKVLDRDGKAVNHGEVVFDGPKKGTSFTDARGEFAFTGPGGEYSVTVKAGSRKQDFTVQIENNQLKPSTLIIEPEGLM